MNCRIIRCSIHRPVDAVYEFAANPENLPRWVTSFCLSVRKSGEYWEMETPTGWVQIRFVPRNEAGIMDHMVTLPDGQAVVNPMRVVDNGGGSEVMFTLFQQPGMSDEQFARDADMVDADLQSLKKVLEGQVG
ncbi:MULTISPECIES: SRPBCC family protein [unclassified Schlesneria]|uniref:SRPBCC family protein n=1 Tax=unclassified Schlesneria TaxID=2762017 RepID=UPI002EF9F3E7